MVAPMVPPMLYATFAMADVNCTSLRALEIVSGQEV